MRQLPDRILVAREAFLTVPELENVIGAQGTGRVKEPRRTRNRVSHIAEIEPVEPLHWCRWSAWDIKEL